MFNPDHQLLIMEDRKQRLLQEARMVQLWREADRDRSSMGERLMALVGDLMISGGTKLKERSAVRFVGEAQLDTAWLQEAPYS
jgi:hypothetical protein